MVEFSKRFMDRYHDVAIAEQHAVTLAAGLACENQKPVVAIYSTFLQRAYDQIIHDVALQNLDVTFAIDRAGIVGEDGPTHAGSFDISYLRCIPNMVIATPSDENECRQLLFSAYDYRGPSAIRYPRGKGYGAHIEERNKHLAVGKGAIIKAGKDIAILNFGTLLPAAIAAANKLNASVFDMRWAKPLDEVLINELAHKYKLLVTLEENTISGGAGSGVAEYLNAEGILIPILHLGLPDDFIDHGKREQLLSSVGLDQAGIYKAINDRFTLLFVKNKSKVLQHA